MIEGATPDAEALPEPRRVLFPSPIGVVGVEARDEVITRVAIVPVGRERASYTALAELKRSPESDFLEEVVGRFSEYFAGARRNLDLRFDLRDTGLDPFSRRVLKQATRIPYGRTRTHQDVAVAVGRADGYRQVLAILMANPLPILVPCHRVVPSKAGAGSWVGGAKKKEWLLKMEARVISAG